MGLMAKERAWNLSRRLAIIRGHSRGVTDKMALTCGYDGIRWVVCLWCRCGQVDAHPPRKIIDLAPPLRPRPGEGLDVRRCYILPNGQDFYGFVSCASAAARLPDQCFSAVSSMSALDAAGSSELSTSI
jgi:hypothetical protein